MGSRSVRHAGVAAVAVALLLLTTAAPGGAQEPPDLTPQGGLTPDQPITADKAATSALAQSDPTLLARTDAAPVPVMIKLDYDSTATYQGGREGLDATSPAVTGEPLTGDSAAERAYGRFVDDQVEAFRSDLAGVVPEAEVGGRFDVVYGGVAAVLPANRVKDVAAMDAVVAVQPDVLNQPLTDSSPDFLGAPTLYDELGGADDAGEGVILGNLDTGIWPEHPSFADLGNLDAPPAPPGGTPRECNYGDNPLTPATDVFACQNKLIGGAHFTDTYDTQEGDDPFAGTARDGNGHGTHTSSTSAGNPVEDVSVLGTDRGDIQGLAPGAWIMEYKVCGPQGCFGSDTTEAVGQAILDGVDVINYSISGGEQPFADSTELAFLDAYAAGVFVSTSAGNEGPGAGTANHLSPWTTAVAASTQQREFASDLHLTADDGETLTVHGATVTQGVNPATPLVLASQVPGYGDPFCGRAPAPSQFAGVIVACQAGGDIARVLKGLNVRDGGGAGLVIYNPILAAGMTDNHFLPAIHLYDGSGFLTFMGSHTGVTGSWNAGQRMDGVADSMASFSSRGPAGQFIKPDVTAPGIQILAGASPWPGDPADGGGQPGEMFMAIGGTSMSSPHVAGSGLLLAALHPDWSPGQIRSALMTSATTELTREDRTTPADPFDMGSGRIDLTRAGSVALSFDETPENFFTLGADPVNAVHLNIPSINAPVMPGRVDTTRTATNVSGRTRRFNVGVDQPASGSISVTPSRFTLEPGQSITLNVTIEAPVPGDQQFGQINITGRGEPAQHLPVAFVPQQTDVNLIQSCSPTTIRQRATSACTVAATNNSFAETTVDIATEVGRGLRVAGTDGGEQTGPRSAALADVTLSGRRPGVPSVDSGSLAGYIPLDDFGVTPIPVGDEQIVNFTTPAFEYAGQTWDRVGVDSNGYLIVGGGDPDDNNCCNLPDGPDPARPNNVLAPFWTDLDGTGAAGIFAEVLTDGTSSWLVLEWRVNVFGTDDLRTFQTWIGIDGEEDITYAYDPASMPTDPDGQDFLVGAENLLGDGDMEAVLPSGDLRVTSTDAVAGDSVSYVVFAQGRSEGPWPVTSSMNASGVPGTTVVSSEVTVTRR
jgi:subtilase family protein/fibronectin type III domain protein